jgi:uncharacterized protein YrzB (UPF0473 family)
MNDEAHSEHEDALVTLEGEDGNSYSCQILDIFEFEQNEYALLLKVADTKPQENGNKKEDEEDESLVIMRLIQRDDQSIFQTIESDEEFDKVVAHVEELARQHEETLSAENNH